MGKIKEQFVSSIHQMKHVRVLTVTAMLAALAVVLSFYTLVLSESMKIGFSFLPKELTGFFFGPVVGAAVGVVVDIVGYVVKPTGPFFPGFTLNAALAGVIYGIILYRKPLTLGRVFAANLAVSALINLLLSTLWISCLYGSAFWVILPARGIKQLVMLPIETALFYGVARALERAKVMGYVQVRQ